MPGNDRYFRACFADERCKAACRCACAHDDDLLTHQFIQRTIRSAVRNEFGREIAQLWGHVRKVMNPDRYDDPLRIDRLAVMEHGMECRAGPIEPDKFPILDFRYKLFLKCLAVGDKGLQRHRNIRGVVWQAALVAKIIAGWVADYLGRKPIEIQGTAATSSNAITSAAR